IIHSGDILTKYNGGAINIIDLANTNSCAFIATDDVGKLYPDGSFEIIGRLDNSDIRGCGLMLL
ncbi:MAG: acyl transferase, partial [Ferruginibacter sp.]